VLAEYLDTLRSTTYRDAEIVVVLGAGTGGIQGFPGRDAFPFPVRVVRPEPEADLLSVAAGAAASNDSNRKDGLVLFLSTTVRPINDDWLGLLVETLTSSEAAAVGPRLVHPRWRGSSGGPGADVRDLGLASRGVGFDRAHGVPMATPLGDGEDATGSAATGVTNVPALLGACLLVRRSALEAIAIDGAGPVEGFDELDGVDLSLRLRAAGWQLRYDGRAAMWHDGQFGVGGARSDDRRQALAARWGARLFREAFLDALAGGRDWSNEPVHVGITLTRDDPDAGFGDYYTGHELGDALAGLGWRVSYLERQGNRWYDPDPTIEVVIALLESFDIRRLPRRLVTIAWVRNWAERWLDQAWFDDFDLVFASSARIADLVRERSAKVASILPIATNPERFHPQPVDPEQACDVLFVGSYWGQHRAVVDALPALAASGASVHVYVRGWEQVPSFAAIHRGFLDYDQIPAAYASADIVVDDAASSTLPYGSVNSRVFDALATGAVVVSNGVLGVEELFGPSFPTWTSAADLVDLVGRLRADPDRTAALAARDRSVVLERHTYRHRAAQVRDALAGWATADRWGIRIGVPAWDQIDQWGDYFFARGIQRVLERHGRPTRVQLLPEWSSSETTRDDVSLHLFGLSQSPLRVGQVNLLWQISHPELANAQLYDRYDRVFVASDPFAAAMAQVSRGPVEALHQATDPERFRPDVGGPDHELLFVANSRKVRRKIVDDLAGTAHDLAVYGRGWTPDLIEPRFVKGDGIPNTDLARYYRSAAIVLNDHWDDMRANGFLSNRLYDALAAGAFVISDRVDGIDGEFDGAIPTYATPDELEALIDRFLAEPETRRSLAERGRQVVLELHTFEIRVRTLMNAATEVLADRPRTIRSESWRAGAEAH